MRQIIVNVWITYDESLPITPEGVVGWVNDALAERFASRPEWLESYLTALQLPLPGPPHG